MGLGFTKGREETFENDVYVHLLDYHDDFMCMFTYTYVKNYQICSLSM